MRKYKTLSTWLILFTFVFSILPANIAEAFSLSDLLATASTAGVSTAPEAGGASAGLTDLLLSLLFGKWLGGLFPSTESAKTPAGAPSSLPLTGRELIGFYAEWWSNDTASYNSLSQNLDTVKTVAPFWATLDENGNVMDRVASDHKAVVDFAHKNSKPVLLLVNNAKEAKNGALPVHSMLRSQDLRQQAINNLEAYMKKYNLDGINIDFEMVPAEDKPYLTAFMRELSGRLKPQGYIVSIDVFPKQDETNDVAAAYDYVELAKCADKIIIMTYDNHGVWSGPGPIADINWVEKNLAYALQFIPKQKLYLGIAGYGYDWSGSTAESVEYKQRNEIIQQFKPAVLWDASSKSPHFSYTDAQGAQHQVWFESSDSIKYKLDLVNKYDIAGAALWRLGGEDPSFWPVLKEKLIR